MDALSAKRTLCKRCHYPQKTCICHAVQRIPSAPEIMVIQHYREAKHAKNTLRLAQLCLPASKVINVKTDEDISQCIRELKNKRVALFFPTPESKTLENNTSEFNKNAYDVLLFIDGSWRQSKGITRKLSLLRNFDQWQLNAESTGRYRIRHTPLKGAFSTLEAIAMTLDYGYGISPEPLYKVLSAFQSRWMSRIKKSDED